MMLLIRSIALALMFAVLGSAAQAQNPAADPPGRAARLSEFSGQVWLYNADSGEWVSAVRNRPLTAGDRLATDPGARAEMQLGSTTVRLDSGSELEVVALDDERLSLQLHNGSAAARIHDLTSAGLFDLSTDEGRFVVLRAGSYRFDRDGSASRITVYSGQARYEGPNSGLQVNAGQRAEFWIDSGGVAQYSMSAPVNDAFAAWNSDRDRRIVESVSARYVSPEMTGADELDRYGRWEQNPDYGAVWIPAAVAVDWAPYRNGHWAWVQPWGWTWVDDAPWGFAPFHYGRWVNVHNNWCWTPGTRVARPVYAPALVAWVGGPRANVSITVGGGPAVGWFPLAPREVYVPSYRVSPHYAQNVNITNVTNVTVINNVFANPQAPREFGNRRFPNAITVVPTAVMTSRQPVAPAAAQMRQRPEVREIAMNPQPGRGAVTLIAPPVAAPVMPAHGGDPRGVRPPPGAVDRPAVARPGMPTRERDRERDRDREFARPDAPREAPRGQPPVAQAPAAAPAVTPNNPVVPRPPGRAVLPSPSPAPVAPVREAQPPAPAPITRPAPAAPAQEGPMMRPQPVRRGEDRREPPRPNEAPAPAESQRPPPRGEPPQRPAPVTAPAPAVVVPTPRPAEPARPVMVAPRPAPAAAPAAPAPQPEMKRPEPRPRPEAPKEGPEPRRGEQRVDPREQQR